MLKHALPICPLSSESWVITQASVKLKNLLLAAFFVVLRRISVPNATFLSLVPCEKDKTKHLLLVSFSSTFHSKCRVHIQLYPQYKHATSNISEEHFYYLFLQRWCWSCVLLRGGTRRKCLCSHKCPAEKTAIAKKDYYYYFFFPKSDKGSSCFGTPCCSRNNLLIWDSPIRIFRADADNHSSSICVF